MIPPLYKWYPMVQPGGEPTKTDALERRAERMQEEYAQALKMKKVKRVMKRKKVKVVLNSQKKNVNRSVMRSKKPWWRLLRVPEQVVFQQVFSV